MRQAMEAIRAAGGRPGLFITGAQIGPAADGLFQRTTRVIVDIRQETGNPDALAFDLKTRFIELRAAPPGRF